MEILRDGIEETHREDSMLRARSELEAKRGNFARRSMIRGRAGSRPIFVRA